MLTLDQARAKSAWLPDAFFAQWIRVCRRFGMNPVEALAVLYMESGVHGSAENASSHAAGLIQWMPENRPRGLSLEELKATPELTQLIYVEEWFASFAGRLHGRPFASPGMVYLTVFAPGRLSPLTTEDTEVFAAPDKRYAANAVLDVDKNGVITVGDLSTLIRSKMREPGFEKFRVRLEAAAGGPIPTTPPSSASSGSSAGFATIGVMVAVGVVAAVAAAVAHVVRS